MFPSAQLDCSGKMKRMVDKVAIFPIIFSVGAWFVTLYLIAWIGGWQTLAEKYGVDNSYSGTWKAWQWGKIGKAAYKRCLWTAIDARGLYVKVGPFFPCNAFHRTLLIPWSAIRRVEESKYWWLETLTIKLNDPDIEISFEPKTLEGASQFLGDKMALSQRK